MYIPRRYVEPVRIAGVERDAFRPFRVVFRRRTEVRQRNPLRRCGVPAVHAAGVRPRINQAGLSRMRHEPRNISTGDDPQRLPDVLALQLPVETSKYRQCGARQSASAGPPPDLSLACVGRRNPEMSRRATNRQSRVHERQSTGHACRVDEVELVDDLGQRRAAVLNRSRLASHSKLTTRRTARKVDRSIRCYTVRRGLGLGSKPGQYDPPGCTAHSTVSHPGTVHPGHPAGEIAQECGRSRRRDGNRFHVACGAVARHLDVRGSGRGLPRHLEVNLAGRNVGQRSRQAVNPNGNVQQRSTESPGSARPGVPSLRGSTRRVSRRFPEPACSGSTSR